MTWVRIDDRFPTHRKALAAGPLGRDLYVCALAYSNLHLTDGQIPRAALESISACPPGHAGRGVNAWSSIVKRTAERLVEVGLWEARDGGYQIHDFHAWGNKTANEVNGLRHQKAEAGRRGGHRSGEARRKQSASSTFEAPGQALSKQSGSGASNPSPLSTTTPYIPHEAAEADPKHPASRDEARWGDGMDGVVLPPLDDETRRRLSAKAWRPSR